MANYYGCSTTTVRNYANKIGFDINTLKNYKLSESDKKYIIDAYYDKTSTELAK